LKKHSDKCARCGRNTIEEVFLMQFLKSAILSLIAVGLVGSLLYPDRNPLLRNLRRDVARVRMEQMALACQHYIRMEQRSPYSLQELIEEGYAGRYMQAKKLLQDPFGQKLLYRPPSPRRKGEIMSAGPDRLPGTPDDIRVSIPFPQDLLLQTVHVRD
jgi:hypothetical protein